MPQSAISLFEQRRRATGVRLERLRKRLQKRGWESRIAGKACVYVTGSVGRGEASAQSDLDVFILSGAPKLPRLDAIELEADLIKESQKVGFPPFSGDGQWLQVYELDDMLTLLGSREDDGKNVFTARLLMLLESQCLLGQAVYQSAIVRTIGEYWRDFDENEDRFHPVFLMNDILKYWKVLCLEYEYKNAPQRVGELTETEKARRRYNNYKLKHSRLLICYSAIVYLASCWLRSRTASRHLIGTVTPADARGMVARRPLDRLVHVCNTVNPKMVAPTVQRIFDQYALFLETTETDRDVLIKKFKSKAYRRARREEANSFGDSMYELIYSICGDLPIFRYLVV